MSIVVILLGLIMVIMILSINKKYVLSFSVAPLALLKRVSSTPTLSVSSLGLQLTDLRSTRASTIVLLYLVTLLHSMVSGGELVVFTKSLSFLSAYTMAHLLTLVNDSSTTIITLVRLVIF